MYKYIYIFKYTIIGFIRIYLKFFIFIHLFVSFMYSYVYFISIVLSWVCFYKYLFSFNYIYLYYFIFFQFRFIFILLYVIALEGDSGSSSRWRWRRLDASWKPETGEEASEVLPACSCACASFWVPPVCLPRERILHKRIKTSSRNGERHYSTLKQIVSEYSADYKLWAWFKL